MKCWSVVLTAVLGLAGCGAGGPAIQEGDEVTLRKSGAYDGKGWLPVDVQAFLEMGKPLAEFNKVFDQLVAEKRIFLEKEGAHAVVVETRFMKTKAARIRIKDGLNPGREAWCPISKLEPIAKH